MNEQWDEIEIQYRSGIKSLRLIANEFGTSESAIRRRAKRFCWIRDNGQLKREKVKKAIKSINIAVCEDIEDMERGLANARLALSVVNHSLLKVQDAIVNEGNDEIALMLLEPRNIKTLSEANKLNIELIRRIRSLDDTQAQEATLSEEDIAILERFKNG